MKTTQRTMQRHASCRSLNPRIGHVKRSNLVVRRPCPPCALDQAAAELSSTIGTLAFSGAALYGLAMGIRSANNMDEHDARLAELASTSTVEAAKVEAPARVAAVPATDAVVSAKPVIDETGIEERVNEVRSWIGAWRERSGAAVAAQTAEEEAAAAAAAAAATKALEERQRIEAAHAERVAREQAEAAEKKAKEAEERALAAAKAVAAKEAEMASLKAKAEAQVAERAQQARDWIDSWQKKISSASSDSSESSASSANAAMAAAVLKEMTEDTPVGMSKSSSTSTGTSPSSATPMPSEVEPVAVGVTSSPQAPADTEQVAEKAPQPTRRVSITAEYENKISSLLSSYQKTKQKEREAALRQPKQIVEISAEEIAKATRKTNPVIVFFLKIVAMIQACFAYVKSLFSGSSSSGPGSPATA